MNNLSLTLFTVFSLLSGAFAGYIDVHQSEVQPAVLVIGVTCALLGYLKPAGAWLAALIIGSSIFIAHLAAQWLGYHVRYEVQPGIYGSLLALPIAFLFAYTGAWFRFLQDKRIDQDWRDEDPRG